MRRWIVASAVLTVLLGFHCASYHLPKVAEPPDYCVSPAGPPYRPIVCVDETALTANPKVQVAFDVEPGEGRTPTNRPVRIFWRTHQKFNLQLNFADNSCLDQVECNGQGHCQAVAKPLEMINGVKQSRRCTYRLIDGSQPQKADDEADIVITPCCW